MSVAVLLDSGCIDMCLPEAKYSHGWTALRFPCRILIIFLHPCVVSVCMVLCMSCVLDRDSRVYTSNADLCAVFFSLWLCWPGSAPLWWAQCERSSWGEALTWLPGKEQAHAPSISLWFSLSSSSSLVFLFPRYLTWTNTSRWPDSHFYPVLLNSVFPISFPSALLLFSPPLVFVYAPPPLARYF